MDFCRQCRRGLSLRRRNARSVFLPSRCCFPVITRIATKSISLTHMGQHHYRQLFLLLAVLIGSGDHDCLAGPQDLDSRTGAFQRARRRDPRADGTGYWPRDCHASRAHQEARNGEQTVGELKGRRGIPIAAFPNATFRIIGEMKLITRPGDLVKDRS